MDTSHNVPSVQSALSTKIWTRPEIDAMLNSNDKAVERAMIILFKLQTSHERSTASTNVQNGVGFNMVSATVGTRFARWLQGMDDNNNVVYPPKSLSHEKAEYVFRKYRKSHASIMERARAIALTHSQQLVDVANGTLVIATQVR